MSRSKTSGNTAPGQQDDKSRRERLRREEPQQTEPIRDWRGWFRSDAWGFCPPVEGGSEGEGGNAGDEAPWDRPLETVDRGVKMAYQVVEDYIEEGRRVARHMNDRAYGPRQMTEDFQSLTERMMRDSSRFLSLWFELMASTLSMGWRGWETAWPGVGGRPRSRRRPASAPWETARERRGTDAETDAAEGTRRAVTLEIRSSHLTRVDVDLAPDAGGAKLRSTPLQPDTGDASPLTEVAFEPGDAGRPPVLRLTVPPAQPAGHYHGVLLDPSTHQARGTVTVHLTEPQQPKTKKSGAGKTRAKRSSARKGGKKSSKSSPGKSSGKGGGKR